eukprot:sb/3469647/
MCYVTNRQFFIRETVVSYFCSGSVPDSYTGGENLTAENTLGGETISAEKEDATGDQDTTGEEAGSVVCDDVEVDGGLSVTKSDQDQVERPTVSFVYGDPYADECGPYSLDYPDDSSAGVSLGSDSPETLTSTAQEAVITVEPITQGVPSALDIISSSPSDTTIDDEPSETLPRSSEVISKPYTADVQRHLDKKRISLPTQEHDVRRGRHAWHKYDFIIYILCVFK